MCHTRRRAIAVIFIKGDLGADSTIQEESHPIRHVASTASVTNLLPNSAREPLFFNNPVADFDFCSLSVDGVRLEKTISSHYR